jgi:hypothetical protein
VRLVRGICRLVILVGPYAIKVPTTRPYGARAPGDRLHWWCRGYLANRSERDWSRWEEATGIAPVLHSWLGGVIQVYPRCEPVTDLSWMTAPRETYMAISPVMRTGDCKEDNIGVLDGNIVWLDYDTNWNGCPHAPWVEREPAPHVCTDRCADIAREVERRFVAEYVEGEGTGRPLGILNEPVEYEERP